MDVRDKGIVENLLTSRRRVEYRSISKRQNEKASRPRRWWQVMPAMLIVSGFSPAAHAEELVNNLHFPGHYYDEESGLYYNWNRYYNPKTGRYITSDPIGFAGGTNLYSYVFQNPQKYFDPLGLICQYLGREIRRSWSNLRDEWELLWEISFQAPGPGVFGPDDCVPDFEPPERGGWLPKFPSFPCSLPIDVWLYIVKLWKVTSYDELLAEVMHVYRCVDECTGNPSIVRQNSNIEIIWSRNSDVDWRFEFDAIPLFNTE